LIGNDSKYETLPVNDSLSARDSSLSAIVPGFTLSIESNANHFLYSIIRHIPITHIGRILDKIINQKQETATS